jgi:hypothetical protein
MNEVTSLLLGFAKDELSLLTRMLGCLFCTLLGETQGANQLRFLGRVTLDTLGYSLQLLPQFRTLFPQLSQSSMNLADEVVYLALAITERRSTELASLYLKG